MIDHRLQTDGRVALLEGEVARWNLLRRDCTRFLVLNRSCLPGAQLAHADLHCTILMESDFQRANLNCASLERAVLRKSNFHGSDLRCANLAGADLCRADFSGADLRGASLASAFLKRTNLCGADLSGAIGLTTAQLADAYGDDCTRLPRDVERPDAWASLSLVKAVG